MGELRVLSGHRCGGPGLDIDDVDAVFNYDVPDEMERIILSTASAGPVGAKHHGSGPPLLANITEGIRMDSIVQQIPRCRDPAPAPRTRTDARC